MDYTWRVVLGRYDDDAPSTLVTQLEMLAAIADLRDPRVSLSIELATRIEEADERSATCAISFTMPDELQHTVGESLKDLAGAGLIVGYHLQWNAPALAERPHRAILRPRISTGSELPVSSDWSRLVDYLRRRDEEITVRLACRFHDDRGMRSPSGAPATIRTLQDPAATWLTTVREGGRGGGQLALTAELCSTEPVDAAFASVVGRMVFGVGVEQIPPEATPEQGQLVGYPEELISVWHAPYGNIEGRGSRRGRRTSIAVRGGLPVVAGVRLGEATMHGRKFSRDIGVCIGDEDRRRHVYIIGKTGSGKTNLLKQIARADIAAGRGGAIISPHPDLSQYVIETAGDRLGDIVHLDFGDPTHVPVINPFVMDVPDLAAFRLMTGDLIELLRSQTHNTFTGPVFEDTALMVLETTRLLSVEHGTVPSIPAAMELLRSRRAREWVENHLDAQDEVIADDWKALNGMLGTSVAETSRWVNAKFAAFGPAGTLRGVGGPVRSPLSIRDLYAANKVLLVTLPETTLGSRAVEFLGGFLFSRIYAAAKSTAPNDPTLHFLHVDEFQRFVSGELEEIVAEARKFHLSMTLAHQNLRQLAAFSSFEGGSNSRLGDAIFSNVGTLIAMKSSGQDVEPLAREFQVPERDVRDIGQFDALARVVVDAEERPTFTLRVDPAPDDGRDPAALEQVRARMIAEGLWRDRDELVAATEQDLEELRGRWTRTKRQSPEPRRRGTPAAQDEAAPTSGTGSGSSFLDEWLEKRRQLAERKGSESGAGEDDGADDTIPRSARRPARRPAKTDHGMQEFETEFDRLNDEEDHA